MTTAIVGMAALFPGAEDLESFWKNIEEGRDSISKVPADRWDPVFYDPISSAPDRIYVDRGGFLGSTVQFAAMAHGVMPVAAEGAEPDQLLALEVAARAMRDAGYADRKFARERAGVVVGRGGYLTQGVARLEQRVRGVEQLAQSLRTLVPGIDEVQIDAIKAAMREQLGPYGGDTAIGLVPNLAASRIASRLDLHGSAYTVDAACASSLVAVDHACRDLADGAADLMIAGGVHLCHDPIFYSVFCQLGALSRAQTIRPFDRRADGLLIGEGVGMIVLKRLEDAERDGDRIYAVIRGTGVSSDGRQAGLMAPAVEGQLKALERAWKKAQIDPASIGLIEAHGTATQAGDTAELATLGRFFGPPVAGVEPAGLGSVKSNIGHAMPAAGIAGLIKAALAVHHGVLPPTLHCEEPRAELAQTRFRTLSASEPWETSEGPRRAGVDAFGFGGINAHVVIEQHGVGKAKRRSVNVAGTATAGGTTGAESLILMGAESADALARALEQGRREGLNGPARLAMFNPTPERIARAQAILARGEPWRGREDIWFTPRGLLGEGGKIAFLFPGVDASFKPRVDDVIAHFDLPFRVPADTTSLKELGMGIVAVNRTLDAAVRAIGVVPDAVAGHSIGEWSGMISTEMVPREDLDRIIAGLAPESVEVPNVVFVAAGCGRAQADEAIAGLPDIAVSHDNCPHQVLICGRADSAGVAHDRLAKAGILCQKLPFQSGYHSPLFADYVEPHQRILAEIPLAPRSAPLWSATTCAPYPEDPAAVRELAVRHVVEPVRFRELILALHDDGVRVFIQIGTGSLVGFVDDTLRGKPHLAIPANVPARAGLAQLRRLAAAIVVEGGQVQSERLEPAVAAAAATSGLSRGSVGLRLGVPLIKLDPSLAVTARTPTEPAPAFAEDDPVAFELAENLRVISAAQTDVIEALQARREALDRMERERTFVLEISVETCPWLLDHSFYRQPPGWTNVNDRYPVVPMTMIMALMMDVAQEMTPGLVPIALENVRAYRWMAVAPPVELVIQARYDGDSRVEVTIDGYAVGIVEVARAYPNAPEPNTQPLTAERPAGITATELYERRWMFHGPAYQGVTDLGTIGQDGIRGRLVSLAAQGGLLDNAGQLLGYWVMQNAEVDRLAMPVMIDRCAFFGPEPPPGEDLECTVRILELGPSVVRADIELTRYGRVWVKIDGWEDRRFDSDSKVWDVLLFPETNIVSEVHTEGFVSAHPPWRAHASRDLIARRYLRESERDQHNKLGPAAKNDWLLGRIAIKDAVRHWLWQRGHGPIFPAELEVVNEPSGKPVVRGPFSEKLEVSVAHKAGLAVARVSEGAPIGIDLEKVQPRGPEFETIALVPAERARLPEGPERDVEIARFWVAKEAAGKSRGTGLAGNPGKLEIVEVDGPRLTVRAQGETVKVETTMIEGHIVGWTCT